MQIYDPNTGSVYDVQDVVHEECRLWVIYVSEDNYSNV